MTMRARQNLLRALGDEESLKVLLAAGADVNHADIEGKTAIFGVARDEVLDPSKFSSTLGPM